MQQFNTLGKNSKQEVLRELQDHTYEQAIELDDAGANFKTSTSTSQSPRIKCNAWLQIHDIMDEVLCGTASLLYIICSSSLCLHVDTMPSRKRSDSRSFDANSKTYLGNFSLFTQHLRNFDRISLCLLGKIQPKICPCVKMAELSHMVMIFS